MLSLLRSKMFGNVCYVVGIVVAIGIGMQQYTCGEATSADIGSAVPCPNKELRNPCQLGSTTCTGDYSYKGTGKTAYMVKLTMSDQSKQCYQANATCTLYDVYSVDTNCE